MQAFELTDQAKKDGFSGGSIMCSPSGHMLDVKQALDDGDGVIVTDSPVLTSLLHNYEALQPTEVPEGAETVAVPGLQDEAATVAPPWISQEGTGGVVTEVAEIPAEHLDATADVDPASDPTGGDESDSDSPTGTTLGSTPWAAVTGESSSTK